MGPLAMQSYLLPEIYEPLPECLAPVRVSHLLEGSVNEGAKHGETTVGGAHYWVRRFRVHGHTVKWHG
jgi:hypothetical protein